MSGDFETMRRGDNLSSIVAGLKGYQSGGGYDLAACADIALSRRLADLRIAFCFSVAACSTAAKMTFAVERQRGLRSKIS